MMNKKKTKKKKHGRQRASRHTSRKRRNTVWLNVLPNDLWLEVKRGTTILTALQKENIDLAGDCGGLGKCGKCKVRVLTSTGLPLVSKTEIRLDDEELRQGIRLACRTKINKDMTVYLGESEPELKYHQILKTGILPLLEFDPLVQYCPTELPVDLQKDGRSDLALVRAALGPAHQQLKGCLSCLRSLTAKIHENTADGTAVIHDKTLLDWLPGKTTDHHFGLVFDLGTSTVVGKLINLSSGRQPAAVSCLNSQQKYGADVISRLQHVRMNKDGLDNLHLLMLKDLNNLAKRLLQLNGLQPADIFVVVAAGNTTMQHFLLNLDPSGIAEAPFSPVVDVGIIVKSADAGLNLHPEALLYVMPVRSGYVGGDLLSVIIASQAAEQDEKVILGIDLGTNGEIFLGNQRRILTCSTAVGPAMEGAKISSGTIAKAGAIEGVRFQNGQLHYKDVGNIGPIGICGSGLVDLVAVLTNCGIIDNEGLIRPTTENGMQGLNNRVIDHDGVYDFLVADADESYHNKPIYLTQKDVRELQFAKAAIAAGIETLLSEWGADLKKIDTIYLAGALGNYVNPYSAIRIGLIPAVDPDIISSLGNAASTGASMVLLSRDYWHKANELAHTIEHVELSSRPDFSDRFISQMDFPKENLWDRRSITASRWNKVNNNRSN